MSNQSFGCMTPEELQRAKTLGELIAIDINEAITKGTTYSEIGSALGATIERWFLGLEPAERVRIWNLFSQTMAEQIIQSLSK